MYVDNILLCYKIKVGQFPIFTDVLINKTSKKFKNAFVGNVLLIFKFYAYYLGIFEFGFILTYTYNI